MKRNYQLKSHQNFHLTFQTSKIMIFQFSVVFKKLVTNLNITYEV